MRELPEPEGYFLMEDSGYIGGGAMIRTGDFTLEQVLAIQKQAYEDGLRDAPKGMMLVPIEPTIEMKNAAIEAGEKSYIEHINHALVDGPEPKFETTAEAIYSAMLTASQKRDE